MSWLEKFPGVPRPVQAELIQKLEFEWENFDIFVISSPTGSGKSRIAKTLQNIFPNSAYLAPTNQLVEQYLASFPHSRTLKRLDSYWCGTHYQPCSVTRARFGGFCRFVDTQCEGCRDAGSDLSYAIYRRGPLVCNYHTLLSHKIERELLIIDEAHNTIPVIQDLLSKHYWQEDLGYPDFAYSYEKLTKWVESLPKKKLESKRMQLIYENLVSKSPKYILSRGIREFNGKGTRRGYPEERDCLIATPADISTSAGGYLWRRGTTKKLVLLSATIGREDVLELGLHKYLSSRICYLECDSPIPPENRLVYTLSEFMIPVTYESTKNPVIIQQLATNIHKIAYQYPDCKGVVHATYSLANQLVPYLQAIPNLRGRLISHTHDNKQDKYQEFLSNKTDGILIASGMYEGIDLPGDLGRFQIITKVPWPSLANPAVKYKSSKNPQWYIWETLKSLIQASGRISRGPEDFGDSFILDTTWWRLFNEASRAGQIPAWFLECLRDVND